jgi:UDP-glucose 6-dehydrogenase
MMKYAFNTFFITKIVYANSIYDACEASGANYKTIREALMSHPWGSKHHFKVFHKGGRGGGGHCFPKDIKAFAKWSSSKFFKTVEELNTGYLQESNKE